jgi:hypothetical protein
MIRFAKLVVITALVASFACSKAERFEEIDIAKLPQIDYCELRDSPDRYDGKIVKIRAQIANFGHGDYFDDERCSRKVYENLRDDDRTAVRYYEPHAAKLRDALKQAGLVCCLGDPTSIIAIGRFTREYPAGGSDLMSDRTSFHFELYSVEPVSK